MLEAHAETPLDNSQIRDYDEAGTGVVSPQVSESALEEAEAAAASSEDSRSVGSADLQIGPSEQPAVADSGEDQLLTAPEPPVSSEDLELSSGATGTTEPVVTSQIFLDLAIDGKLIGRVTIGLYGKDVPVGAARMAALAKGDRGVSLRRKEFLRLTPAYVQNAGVRTFSLSGSAADEARFPGGSTPESVLLPELEQNARDPRPALHNVAGAVSLLVTDPTIPPPTQRLVARDGKLVTVEEEVRPKPNGTEFAVLFGDAPELDVSHLVVGRVLEDPQGALAAVRTVPYVKDNTGSPYFRAAKLIGDSRAVVAERGFYRPYRKITVTQSGVL